jgi:hypothetical protein
MVVPAEYIDANTAASSNPPQSHSRPGVLATIVDNLSARQIRPRLLNK